MRDDINFLKHILTECEYISSNLTKNTSLQEFLDDQTLQRAVVRSLEIIGEATKSVSSNLKADYDKISWKKIAGMRDRLIHGYMNVDYELVYNVAIVEIPGLRQDIKNIIALLEKEK